MSYCACVFTHYVPEPVLPDAPVTALCGKVWVPTKDAGCHRRCAECAELLEAGPMGWVA